MSGPLPPPYDYARVQRVRARRTTKLPTWLLGSLIGLFVVATVLAGYLVFTSVRDIVAGFQIGAPSGHTLEVREVRLSAGAGFVVAVCGDIMTMPGLPRHPAAEGIGLDEFGQIVGLA